MSVISMKQLLEAGVHFGHPTRLWNPKMGKYIFTARNGIHILDLEITEKLVDEAYNAVKNVVLEGKTVLFVGTKKQASKSTEEEAVRAGMFYVSNRWLGGTLTNFKTIRSRVDRLNKIYNMEKMGEFNLLTKKEVTKLIEEREKLEKNLGGIKNMTNLPGMLFVVDPKTEHLAIHEAHKLGIPVAAICDTNCDPSVVDYVVPGNDDAISSVKLILSAMADACIEARVGFVPGKEAAAEPAEQEQEEKAEAKAPKAKVEEKVEKAPAAKKEKVETK